MAVVDQTGKELMAGDSVLVEFKVVEKQLQGQIYVLVREVPDAGQRAIGIDPRATSLRFGCHISDLVSGAFMSLPDPLPADFPEGYVPGPPPEIGDVVLVRMTVATVDEGTQSVGLLRQRMQVAEVRTIEDLRTTPVSFGCDGLQTLWVKSKAEPLEAQPKVVPAESTPIAGEVPAEIP